MLGLTPQQSKTLGFIRTSFKERGVPPSYDEMCGHLGLRSKSGIHRILHGLAERGAIRINPGRARGIDLVDITHRMILRPEIAAALESYASENSIKNETAINELLRGALGLG